MTAGDQQTPRDERRDLRLIEALASGCTLSEAAELSHCSISTVQRRLRDHQFYAEVLNTRHAALDVTVGMLAAATGLAAKTLLTLLTCDQPPIRLAAARCILEQSVRLRDAADLERRVMALEERAEIVPTVLRAVGDE